MCCFSVQCAKRRCLACLLRTFTASSSFVAIFSVAIIALFLFAGKKHHEFNTEAGLQTVHQRLEFRAMLTTCIKKIIAPLQICLPTLLSNLTVMAVVPAKRVSEWHLNTWQELRGKVDSKEDIRCCCYSKR